MRVWMVNINDNAPVFTPSGLETVWVKHEAAKGTLIHIVQAHDPDGDGITFSFTGKYIFSYTDTDTWCYTL